MNQELSPEVIAAAVLAKCRRVQPDFFKPDAELGRSWAEVFSRFDYPPEVWSESVASFYRHATDGQRPSAGDILHHCKVVIRAWEADPRYRQAVRDWRQQRQDERDKQIALGTFGALRGAVRAELPAPSGATGYAISGAYEECLHVPCPQCGAGASEPCVRGEGVKKAPHLARIRAGK